MLYYEHNVVVFESVESSSITQKSESLVKKDELHVVVLRFTFT